MNILHRVFVWVVFWVDGERSGEVQAAGHLASLHATVHLELAIEMLDMIFHCIHRNHQLARNFQVGESVCQQAEHTALLRRKWLYRQAIGRMQRALAHVYTLQHLRGKSRSASAAGILFGLENVEKVMCITREALFLCRRQERKQHCGQRFTLIEEETNKTFALCLRERLLERHFCL